MGWFTHLFVDACWDENQLIEYINWFKTVKPNDNWFLDYRKETGFISYYLYHHLSWSKDVWNMIKHANLSDIKTSLPISLTENEWYRDRVAKKHSESDPSLMPYFFTIDKVIEFSKMTAKRFEEWISIRTE